MSRSVKDEKFLNEWNGLTIDELRFMRASSLIRLEIQKEYLKRKIGETTPFGKSSSRGSLLYDFSNKLTLVQKMILVFKGIRVVTSLISFFKRNK